MKLKISRSDWLRVGQAMDWLKSAEGDGLIPPDVLRDIRRGRVPVKIVDDDGGPPEGSIVRRDGLGGRGDVPEGVDDAADDADFLELLGGPEGVRGEIGRALGDLGRRRRRGDEETGGDDE